MSGVSTKKPDNYVVAKCPGCKQKKEYDMSIPLKHMPMCEKCFLPMIVQKVVVTK